MTTLTRQNRLTTVAATVALSIALSTQSAAASTDSQQGEEAAAEAVAEAVAEAAPALSGLSTPAENQDGSFRVEADEHLVTIPASGAGVVDFNEAGFSIGLPEESSDRAAALASDGSVIFAADQAGPATSVQTFEGGVRIQTLIDGPASPTTFTYPVADSDLVSRPDGGLSITKSAHYVDDLGQPGSLTVEIGSIDPPWAIDADGDAVPTHYELVPGGFQQIVDISDVTAFPVVADPSVSEVAACTAAIAGFVGLSLIPWARGAKVAVALVKLVNKYGVKSVANAMRGVRTSYGHTLEKDVIEFAKQAAGVGALAACGI